MRIEVIIASKPATANFNVCLKNNGPRCTHSGAANSNEEFYFAAEGPPNRMLRK